MAVVIRLKRTGRRNRPCFRISVADSRWPRDGRTLETLGLYDPLAHTPELQRTLKVERAQHWLTLGATPSETVRSLFRKMGVYEGEFAPKYIKRDRSGRKKVTAKRKARIAAKADRATRKDARRGERVAAKKAAATAAAGDGSDE